MRTPIAVGLLGVSAVGVLTLGLSMAWGDEPGEDFGDAVVATASGNPVPTTSETLPSEAPLPTDPSTPPPAPPTTEAPPPATAGGGAGGGVVNVQPPGAVQLGDDHGGDDDDDDDSDDDSDDDADDDTDDDTDDEDDENT
jgi:hypothetical protein